MLLNSDTETTIKINLTLREIYVLSEHIIDNYCAGTQLNIIGNGSDVVDYYSTEIIFENSELKNRFLTWLKTLPQESNFGGIRENEYWLDDDILEKYVVGQPDQPYEQLYDLSISVRVNNWLETQ